MLLESLGFVLLTFSNFEANQNNQNKNNYILYACPTYFIYIALCQAINWASLRNKYKKNSLRVLKNTIGRYLIGHAIVSSYKLVNFKGSFKPSVPLGN